MAKKPVVPVASEEAAPLTDPRIGTRSADGRTLPERDLLGKPYTRIASEQGIGHRHFVVVPPAAPQHLIDAALAEVRQVVEDHYAVPVPAAADPAQETPVSASDGEADATL